MKRKYVFTLIGIFVVITAATFAYYKATNKPLPEAANVIINSQKKQYTQNIFPTGEIEKSTTKASVAYKPFQLRKIFIMDGYEYRLVQRDSYNIHLPNSTEFSGVVRHKAGEKDWYDYIEIKSNPDTAANNPYMLWKTDSGFVLLVVDHNGADLGEGVGKLFEINNGTVRQTKCLYFKPVQSYDLANFIAAPDQQGNACSNAIVKLVAK